MKLHTISVLLIVITVLIAFKDLTQSFFEQDEWHSFGNYIYLNSLSQAEFFKNAFPGGLLGHFTPLSLFSKMTMYKFFGLNAENYFIVSIGWHLLVTSLVYIFIYLLFKRKLTAFLGALFFAVNSSHNQSVTWLGTFEGTLGATFFGLLALVSFLLYEHKQNNKYFVLSLASIFLGLLYKEIALTFLLLLCTLIFFLKSAKFKLRFLLGVGIVFGLYISLKFFFTLTSVHDQSRIVQQGNIFDTILFNFVVLPPKLFAQTLISSDWFNFSKDPSSQLIKVDWGKIGYLYINENYVINILILGLFLTFLVLVFLGVKKGKVPKEFFFLSFLIFFFSALPISILKKFTLLIDSRYLYPATVGTSLFLSAFFESFREKVSGRFILVLILLLTTMHLISLKQIVAQEVSTGLQRKDILTQIENIRPKLQNKTIIFIESDRSFYGLKDRIFPFQSGLGQLLLVYYSKNQNIPPDFFTEEFLWNITDQGYKKFDNLGYGFFRDFEKLAETVSQNNLPFDSILGLAYNSENNKVSDISKRVQGELEGKFAKKMELNRSNITASTSEKPEDANLAIDGKRETAWDSTVPYEIPQFFQIDLGEERTVAQIRVDSFTNKDQNEIGYKVSSSLDGLSWKEIFMVRRRPPGENGLVDIYLHPEVTRYIKIEQIGSHKFASWVIHELKIYEVN